MVPSMVCVLASPCDAAYVSRRLVSTSSLIMCVRWRLMSTSLIDMDMDGIPTTLKLHVNGCNVLPRGVADVLRVTAQRCIRRRKHERHAWQTYLADGIGRRFA
eukprot:scaffold16712_cov65-Phaeocystis_antarctica.AAC.5